MYVFALIAFVYYYQQSNFLICLVACGAIIISLVFSVHKKRKSGSSFFRIGLVVAAAGWLLAPQRNIFIACLYLIAALLEKQVKLPLTVGFSEEMISFNTIPRKSLKWDEVNNVVLKDGLLTIDRRNNHLFQKEIESYLGNQAEGEFNNFCKRQLNNPINS